MSYYDNQQWTAGAQQPPSWEQQAPPSRSGASSAVPREDSSAFGTQLEEVDRAVDNLMKSGKMFNLPGRRDSATSSGGPPRDFSQQYDPRMGGGSRHHSVSEFGDQRSFSGSNLQNFYANQRHQPSRGASEAEQVMQAKRRMAAQRERELRNYHQEQQYNRSVVADVPTHGKSDRTMSPGSGMSEEERRELIARQRSALYSGSPAFGENGAFSDNGIARPNTQGSGRQSAAGMRGHSPLAFDHYNAHAESNSQQAHNESQQSAGAQPQERSRPNSTSPSASANPANNFGLFDAAQQSSRTSNSSPGGSPPHQGKSQGGVAPIGTRPAQAANPALNKRSTTPLPSPLSHGFAAGDEHKENRATSAASNSADQQGLGWGAKPGVWGNKSLGVQASVWG